MLKRKAALFLGVSLLFTIFFGNVYAKNISESTVKDNINIKDSELNQIKESITTILNTDYEIMKTGKFKSSKNIIKDPKLLGLVDKNSKFKTKWYKTVNTKALDYKSKLDVINLKKLSNNKCLVKVSYDVEFQLAQLDTKSYSWDEKYLFELKKVDNTWFITKMLDNVAVDYKEFKYIENNTFNDMISSVIYNNTINSQIKNLDHISSGNMKEYIKKIQP